VSSSDHITNVKQPHFTGTGTVGDLVQIFANGQFVGQAFTDSSGNYTVQSNVALVDGTYQITAGQEDVAGNLSAQSGAMTPPLVIITVKPLTPTLRLDPAYDTGTVGDNLTAAIPQLYDGTASAGTTVTLFDGNTLVATIPLPQGQGVTPFSQLLSLADGTHTLTAVSTDAIGNSASSVPLVVTISESQLDANNKFVRALYLQVLGRSGSVAEWNFWTPFLSQLNGRQIVANGIEKSQEGRDHKVISWYQTFLGRTPQNGEEMGFVNALLAGATEEQVEAVILASTEYYLRTAQIVGVSGPSTDTTFIQALYLQLLGRLPAQSEVSSWLTQLPQLQRTGVAASFLGSFEYRSIQVIGLYINELQRPSPPSQQEVNVWVFSGLDMLNIRVGIESSQEYFNVVTGFRT
jgi:hypothetical protein